MDPIKSLANKTHRSRSHGRIKSKTRATAAIRGISPTTGSFNWVKVCPTLTRNPTKSATARSGPPKVRDIRSASRDQSITGFTSTAGHPFCPHVWSVVRTDSIHGPPGAKLDSNMVAVKSQPSARTNTINLIGVATRAGGSMNSPVAARTDDTTRSITKNGK
jgi:hypothetical protein